MRDLTIKTIETGQDSGFSRGAIGNYYNVKLSDNSTIEVSDDEFLERYRELRNHQGRPSIEKLNSILVGKNWEQLD